MAVLHAGADARRARAAVRIVVDAAEILDAGRVDLLEDALALLLAEVRGAPSLHALRWLASDRRLREALRILWKRADVGPHLAYAPLELARALEVVLPQRRRLRERAASALGRLAARVRSDPALFAALPVFGMLLTLVVVPLDGQLRRADLFSTGRAWVALPSLFALGVLLAVVGNGRRAPETLGGLLAGAAFCGAVLFFVALCFGSGPWAGVGAAAISYVALVWLALGVTAVAGLTIGLVYIVGELLADRLRAVASRMLSSRCDPPWLEWPHVELPTGAAVARLRRFVGRREATLRRRDERLRRLEEGLRGGAQADDATDVRPRPRGPYRGGVGAPDDREAGAVDEEALVELLSELAPRWQERREDYLAVLTRRAAEAQDDVVAEFIVVKGARALERAGLPMSVEERRAIARTASLHRGGFKRLQRLAREALVDESDAWRTAGGR